MRCALLVVVLGLMACTEDITSDVHFQCDLKAPACPAGLECLPVPDTPYGACFSKGSIPWDVVGPADSASEDVADTAAPPKDVPDVPDSVPDTAAEIEDDAEDAIDVEDVDSCPHQCVESDTRCVDGKVSTCLSFGDGCTTWSSEVACEDTEPLECRTRVCSGKTCVTVTADDFCFIDDECVTKLTPGPKQCKLCIPDEDPEDWSDAPDDTVCVPATGTCLAGAKCSLGSCSKGTVYSCNDNNPCTDDSCDGLGGCVHEPNAAFCNDKNACTMNDHCDGGACAGTPKDCADENECTVDTCDAGACSNKYTDALCEDGDECTDNVCALLGCTKTNNSAPCDDHNACTVNDACAGGTCGGASLCGSDTCKECSQCPDWATVLGDRCIYAKAVSNKTWTESSYTPKPGDNQQPIVCDPGSRLTTIQSEDDNKVAVEQLALKCAGTNAWIGLGYSASAWTWLFSEGPTEFTSWAGGSAPAPGVDSGAALQPDGKWVDLPATTKLGCVICERKTDPECLIKPGPGCE